MIEIGFLHYFSLSSFLFVDQIVVVVIMRMFDDRFFSCI